MARAPSKAARVHRPLSSEAEQLQLIIMLVQRLGDVSGLGYAPELRILGARNGKLARRNCHVTASVAKEIDEFAEVDRRSHLAGSRSETWGFRKWGGGTLI